MREGSADLSTVGFLCAFAYLLFIAGALTIAAKAVEEVNAVADTQIVLPWWLELVVIGLLLAPVVLIVAPWLLNIIIYPLTLGRYVVSSCPYCWEISLQRRQSYTCSQCDEDFTRHHSPSAISPADSDERHVFCSRDCMQTWRRRDQCDGGEA